MTFANPRFIGRLSFAAASGALFVLAACGQEPSSPPPPKVSAPANTAAIKPAAEPKAAPAVAEKKAAPTAERDVALARRVKQALLGKPELKAHGIDITANGGLVTLFGTADSLAHRKLAGDIASSVEGVKSVENRLAVASGS